MLETEQQLDNLDDAAKAVAQAAEARGKAAALLNQLKDKVTGDAFEYLSADKELLGDEQAASSVVSVINKVFDKIDRGLDLEDVKYIAGKVKKAEKEDDILEYVCRKHGVTGNVPKVAKELLKKIKKIEYGNTDLSNKALEYRRLNKITSSKRNICVVEYKDLNGNIVTKTFVSSFNTHSEENMIKFLKAIIF